VLGAGRISCVYCYFCIYCVLCDPLCIINDTFWQKSLNTRSGNIAKNRVIKNDIQSKTQIINSQYYRISAFRSHQFLIAPEFNQSLPLRGLSPHDAHLTRSKGMLAHLLWSLHRAYPEFIPENCSLDAKQGSMCLLAYLPRVGDFVFM
jgi:hypothetical protein